ncbi:uncharacterized protein LOC119318641 isoform X2 [Triticum dicoccoides]|uniref:uncharacterized protein LOC119318641 isoform X2 n=1 Tax=Triticum dicoccoides TaxID=85692 RepID=UPI001890A9DC|nr:uncharacterized protein LOC119318641 isoform X2 [Triticum dicoccoides]
MAVLSVSSSTWSSIPTLTFRPGRHGRKINFSVVQFPHAHIFMEHCSMELVKDPPWASASSSTCSSIPMVTVHAAAPTPTPWKVLILLYKFELVDETLFLTVTMIGIFWEKQVMPSKKLQLVVVTAMLFACKYLEVSVPLVEDSVLSYDHAYTEGQILEMAETEYEDNVEDAPLMDIDSAYSGNLLAATEHVKEIYKFYRENEFELMDETLFLTLNIIHKFVGKQVVPSKKLQLVVVTAMLLACKYEEVSDTLVEVLVLIYDHACMKRKLLEMVERTASDQDDAHNPSKLEVCPYLHIRGIRHWCQLLLEPGAPSRQSPRLLQPLRHGRCFHRVDSRDASKRCTGRAAGQ